MNIRRSVCTLIAVYLVLWMTAAADGKDKWINIRTKNFNIISNADDGDTRDLALRLEQFRSVFSKLFNIRNVAPVPVTVVVFKNDDAFKPFKPLYNGKPANLAGYFQRGDDENMIALNVSGNELRPMATIYHEYTHLLTSYTQRKWPAWLMEGLAEVYSSFEVKKNQVTLGAPVSSHVYFLREKKFIPLDTLFKVGRDSPFYNERDKQGVFYAESWALAHYLMFGDKSARQSQLVQFIRLIESGVSIDDAFPKAFQTDFITMEKRLRNYIGNSSYNGMIYTLDSTEGEKEMDLRPLADAEVQFYLGDLLLHTHRVDEAEIYFKKAISLDASLAQPHEGLGFVAMRRDKLREAKDYFKEAVGRGSRNHLAHYYYAEALMRAASEGPTVSGLDAETAALMRQELRTSTTLMPGFAPAYELLGVLCLMTGEDLEEGVRALQKARQLEPQNRRFALNLAQLQIRMQEYEKAKQILQPLLGADTEPAIKSSAESLIAMIDSYTRQPPLRDQSTQPPPEPVATSEKSNLERPTLKRRSDSEAPRDASQSPGSAGPTVKIADTQMVDGILAVIECDGRGSMVLAVRTAEKLLRFSVSDPAKLMFYARDPKFSVEIKCGPMNLTAYVFYKPAVDPKSRFAGEAVAVEFQKR